jgi:hypothetical protein
MAAQTEFQTFCERLVMGVILFGGGGAQYSLPEQANLTLIFFPQNCFPDISTNILQNFSDIAKKIYVICAIKDTNIFLRHHNASCATLLLYCKVVFLDFCLEYKNNDGMTFLPNLELKK